MWYWVGKKQVSKECEDHYININFKLYKMIYITFYVTVESRVKKIGYLINIGLIFVVNTKIAIILFYICLRCFIILQSSKDWIKVI